MAQVLKDARANDCLARGLREVCKAIESKKAEFVVLSETCDDDKYKKCVEALCSDRKVNIIKIQDSKTLGQWCGLIRTDAEGQVVKINKCSSCAVIGVNLPDNVKETEAWSIVSERLGN